MACLKLLAAFQLKGLQHIVVCPGSRSAPLAIASGILSEINGFNIITSIDERSAAFLALGLASAEGIPIAVLTTSGTAVANLLPAAVEADRSCQPILLISADRPERLKNCGANQTVNQEEFLKPAARWVGQGPSGGIHLLTDFDLSTLVENSWVRLNSFAGPVHLNLPIEEPLHPSLLDQIKITNEIRPSLLTSVDRLIHIDSFPDYEEPHSFISLNPNQPGVIIAGPWRGSSKSLSLFCKALRKWQSFTKWPIFADPLSAIPFDQPGLISNWELLISSEFLVSSKPLQVLRLGPLPASRNLENWLKNLGEHQLLISEGEPRKIDPLNLSVQFSGGLSSWVEKIQQQGLFNPTNMNIDSNRLLSNWLEKDKIAQDWLDRNMPLKGSISEPTLARWVPRLLPSDFTRMIASSSPVRDWLSFSGKEALRARCFGFRGASGIDGTLSLAMGLSISQGPTLLVTGDLALLHDINGWLFSTQLTPPLVVLLIDNGGGGIFQQLDLDGSTSKNHDILFRMPQSVDILTIAKAHSIPFRQVCCFEDLEFALEWGFAQQQTVLIRVCTNPVDDASARKQIRADLALHLRNFQEKLSKKI